MGGIAGVFSKSEIDAPRVVTKMLRAMKHRAQDGAAVAWAGHSESARSPVDLKASSPREHTAVGYCFTRVLPEDVMQPIQTSGGWFVIDGRVVNDQTLADAVEASRLLRHAVIRLDSSIIRGSVSGAYAACFCTTNELSAIRDPVGLKPLFVGHQDDLMAVASDRKALWSIGVWNPATFQPGARMIAKPEETVLEPRTTTQEETSVEEATPSRLLQLLGESVSVQVSDIDKIAVGFSGGLDSAIIARIAKDAGADVLAVTIGMDRTAEIEQAELAAGQMEMPLAVRRFSGREVEESLDRILWLIEEPNLMKVGIALAVNWTSEVALENERRVVLLGQGSDEQFGGYKRFATILGEHGPKAAQEAVSVSIREAHEVNYQRDEQAVSAIRVELRLPFATENIVKFALGTPIGMKIRSPSDNLRKWILREAAIKLGIPPAIALRPKKAIQHGSGIEKTIRTIARKHQQTPSSYLEQRLRRMKNRGII